MSKLDVDLEGFDHPGWCDRDLCELQDYGDLCHREPGRVILLSGSRTATVVRFRSDEIEDDGSQTVWPSECWLTIGSSKPMLVECPEDAAAIAVLLSELS